MVWTPPPPRSGHPYYMHDAIYAQPGALRLLMRGNEDALAGAAARLKTMDRVILCGIGTSWHATLSASYYSVTPASSAIASAPSIRSSSRTTGRSPTIAPERSSSAIAAPNGIRWRRSRRRRGRPASAW